MFDDVRKSAKGTLIAAFGCCLLASITGVGALAILPFAGIFFLMSCFLYAAALKPANVPLSRKVAFGLAWFGATLTVLFLNSHFRWLVPCWLAYAGVVSWLMRPPTKRAAVLVGLLTISFGMLPLFVFRSTPLRAAVREQDVLWAKVLLAFSADANEREVQGVSQGFSFAQSATITPVLSEAVEAGSPHMLALLLRHGANPNARFYQYTKYGTDTITLSIPVLLPAIWSKRPALVNLLLAAGADPLAQDTYGRDAVQSARQYKYADSGTVLRAAARFRARQFQQKLETQQTPGRTSPQ